ncbi:hypothetical protein P5673_022784 [Acropora cervicornis]|uniref:Uncharacterized protein n=1 Tax=Acropora cervicornis TaxID=6130 RepID=A0AAD9Q675_ACRCE|nr:hypothetical protein P5673_022784 [Acropora cervicornis]
MRKAVENGGLRCVLSSTYGYIAVQVSIIGGIEEQWRRDYFLCDLLDTLHFHLLTIPLSDDIPAKDAEDCGGYTH